MIKLDKHSHLILKRHCFARFYIIGQQIWGEKHPNIVKLAETLEVRSRTVEGILNTCATGSRLALSMIADVKAIITYAIML